MKKIKFLIPAVFLLALCTSCGVNHAFVFNSNTNSTQVHLSNNNFRVIEEVSGTAEVEYVFAFGGMNRRQLFQNAYSDMVRKASLTTGSRALVNLVTEEHVGGVPPFWYRRTITVSAHVVEFTE